MSHITRKPNFGLCENKAQISSAVTAQLISAFVFATRLVQCLFFLNTKFQVSSHLLWLYRPVCVRPGQEPRRPFSGIAAQMMVKVLYSCSLEPIISIIYEPRCEKTGLQGFRQGLTQPGLYSLGKRLEA